MNSYFTPLDQLQSFMAAPGAQPAMNGMYGVSILGATDPDVARLLPPQLQLSDPKHPLFSLYVVNIREPTFASWYMEAGLGLMARYGDTQGVYYLNLQLSGPGSQMGTFIGREHAGIPKKFADRISVERHGSQGRCVVERHGVCLCQVDIQLGGKGGLFHQKQEGCSRENPVAASGGGFYYKYDLLDMPSHMRLEYCDSSTRFTGWEPGKATVTFQSSPDDPWGEIPVRDIWMAAWQECDVCSVPPRVLCEIPDQQAAETFQYLYAGRFDLCTRQQPWQDYQA